MARYQYKGAFFGSMDDKLMYILEGINLFSLKYIGKESKLSDTEEELRILCIKDINKVIKTFGKKYKGNKFILGNNGFGCIQSKQIFILKGVIIGIEYIGEECKLSKLEKELKTLSIRKINTVIKILKKKK
jgi:hypothetical protein